MNDERFDAVARILSSAPTRRKALGLLSGSAGLGLVLAGIGLGGLADLPGVPETEAVKNKRKRKKRKKRKRRGGGGPPLFPDLQMLNPGDLHFDRLENGQRIIRFTTTIWNAGQGRLELEGNVDPGKSVVKKVFQNLYDAPVGGRRVGRLRVNGRIIYHPEHKHYHFADFAVYSLLVMVSPGNYQLAAGGTKVSFCITDNNPLNSGFPGRYLTCQRRQQGLTPGWGDTYASHLPDQWIVIGFDQLGDGEYAIQVTVDPLGLLHEGGGVGEGNNTNSTFFTVDDGEIKNVRFTP
jgi:hypothetical protein